MANLKRVTPPCRVTTHCRAQHPADLLSYTIQRKQTAVAITNHLQCVFFTGCFQIVSFHTGNIIHQNTSLCLRCKNLSQSLLAMLPITQKPIFSKSTMVSSLSLTRTGLVAATWLIPDQSDSRGLSQMLSERFHPWKESGISKKKKNIVNLPLPFSLDIDTGSPSPCIWMPSG